MKRGQIWYAHLDPAYGYEQGGERPVIIIQNNFVSKIAKTVVVVPLTTNTKQSNWKTNVLIPKEHSGLVSDSLALCHQIRVLDKDRLDRQVGELSNLYLSKVDKCLFYTLGFSSLVLGMMGFYWFLG